MARADISVQLIDRSGLEPSYTAATADGEKFVNNGRVFIHVKNGDASQHTVTVQTPGTVDGLDVAERTVDIPAGEERIIGPFPPGHYNQADGKVYIDYDAVTSITLAAIRLGL